MYFGHDSFQGLPGVDAKSGPDLSVDNIMQTSHDKKGQGGEKKEQKDAKDAKDDKKKPKKDDDDFSSKSSEQRFILKLATLNMPPTIEVDEEEMKKPHSDVTLGGESYILDLARQRETRKRDLQEEALEDALLMYKKKLKEGSEETDELFLTMVVEAQNILTEEYEPIWEAKDTYLEQALQYELERRTKESVMTIDVQDEANARGSKGQRITAYIAKGNSEEEDEDDEDEDQYACHEEYDEEYENDEEEEYENDEEEEYENDEEGKDNQEKPDANDDEDNGDSGDDNDDQENNEPTVEGSERISDKSLETIDLAGNDEGLENGKVENVKKESGGGGLFSSLFGRKKQDNDAGNDSKTTDGTAPAKSSDEQPQAGGDDSGNDLKAMEEGTGDKKSNNNHDVEEPIQIAQQKKFTRLIIVGIIVFFLFDAALLVLLFLKD
jgi:hypothetical protein